MGFPSTLAIMRCMLFRQLRAGDAGPNQDQRLAAIYRYECDHLQIPKDEDVVVCFVPMDDQGRWKVEEWHRDRTQADRLMAHEEVILEAATK